MSKLQLAIAMSLDGFVAGPDQSVENPLGIGGERLHEWAFELAAWREAHGLEGGEVNASEEIVKERSRTSAPRSWAATCSAATPARGRRTSRGTAGGATIRPSTTPSSCSRTTPASRSRCEGGTTFTFVTDGHRVGAGAGARGGGRQGHLARGRRRGRAAVPRGRPRRRDGDQSRPIFLGDGERLFEGLGAGNPRFVHTRTVDAPGVTHLKFVRA